MASPWENIMASPEFSAMTPEQKQRTRDIFFDEAIAPEAGGNTEVLEKARGYFNSQFDFMPKPQPEQEPGAMGAFLQSAKHEAGSGLGGGIGGALGAMGAGALAGASSGSVVPGWGTLAGGIVGALAGGFLGKKTQQAIQGKEAYEKEAQELAKVAEQHPIATSTGALLPALPTMMLAPGAGAITKIAGIGDEVTNIAAQAIRRASPQLTDDAVKMAANSFRLMKPADAVKYAQSLGLGDDAANAIQNAAVSTAQRLGGQALESGVQMGIMAGGESAAQVAEGNKSIADIPGDILKGVVTGAPLGLMGPVALGKGKLGSALGGALIKGPADAALMATGEEAYDAATGKSDGFSLQRAGERAVGMLPSFSLLAGGMGVFHGKPEFKKPPELKPQEADTSLLPELAKPESIQEHEAIQNYLRAKESGNPDELVRAADELAKAREAEIPQPTPLEKAAAQTENAGSSPVLTEALKKASANLDAQKAAEMDRRLSQMEDEGLLADVISAEREKALQRQEAEAAKQREEQYQKLKEQQNAIPERSAEEVGAYPSGDEGIGRTEESQRVGPIEQRIETTPEENRELGEEKIDLTEGEQRNRDILQEAANKLKGLQKAPEIPSVFPALFKLLKRQGDPLQKAPEIPSVFPETIPAPSEGQVRVKELNKEVEIIQPQADISGMKRDASKPEQMTPEERDETWKQSSAAKERGAASKSVPANELGKIQEAAEAQLSGYLKSLGVAGAGSTVETKAWNRFSNGIRKAISSLSLGQSYPMQRVYSKARHARHVSAEAMNKKPVSKAAVDTYGITLPEGYVQDGELYVYRPSGTVEAKSAPPAKPAPQAEQPAPQRDTTKPEQMTPEEFDEYVKQSGREYYLKHGKNAPMRTGQLNILQDAIEKKLPVSVAAFDAQVEKGRPITLPEGYVQDGELYVYRPSGTVEAKSEPTPKEPEYISPKEIAERFAAESERNARRQSDTIAEMEAKEAAYKPQVRQSGAELLEEYKAQQKAKPAPQPKPAAEVETGVVGVPPIERKKIDATFERILKRKSTIPLINGMFQIPYSVALKDPNLRPTDRNEQSLRYRTSTKGEVTGDFNARDSRDTIIFDESVRGARAPQKTPTGEFGSANTVVTKETKDKAAKPAAEVGTPVAGVPAEGSIPAVTEEKNTAETEKSSVQRDTSKPEQMTTGERGQNINPDFNNWGSFKTRKAAQQALDDRIDNVPPNSPMHNIAGEYGLTIRDLYKIGKGQLPSGKIAWGIGKTPQHEIAVGAQQELPISSEAVEAYGIKLPKGYVRQGDLYVFRPENTAAPEGGPIPRGGVNEFPETQREDRPAVVDEQITPEVTESTKEIAPEDRALISLNEFISTIKNEKGRASWTPEVIAKAQKFFQSHDVNDLAGLNKVQSSRIKEIERQSFPEIQKQVRAEGRNLAKKEREDELFAKEIPKEREDELFAKEIPKERAEEPVEEVFSDEDMDNLSAQIRRDLDAEGLRPSIAGGEEKIPAEAKASSDLIAARGNFEEAQKAFNEAHQPIPIAEATPERIDSILARRKQTADSLEAAKAKLKYEAVRDLTKHLPWEQRTKEMEGITDADTLEKHKQSVKEAAAQRKPVSIEASKEYGIKLDSDYQADRFGIARPTLDRRIQPFKEYGERGAITSEKVSSEQVREAIKSLPAEVRRMLEKSGFDIISREEASKLDGITPEFAAKAEGFFYDGKIYVIPENIKVTTKDVGALKAAARVLVHENLHEAFNAVVAKDPKAMEEWKGLLKQIPENDLEALARDYQKGDDWRRDSKAVTDLAEEWLAKKWEDYQGGKMVEAEKPIFERILSSIRKIIDRVFGGIRQFKTQDEDLEAFFDKLSKDRLRVKGGEGELKASLPADETAEKARLEKMPVTPEMNAKYMEAVKNGDMETAQRMVDEAAKAAGYNIGPVFHGTKGKKKGVFPFTTFDTGRRGQNTIETGHDAGSYFAEDRKYAEGAAYSQTNMGRSGKPVVGAFFLRSDVRRTPGVETAVEYMATDPSQIKSADPVTYDNQGDPIPLSERFNPESKDIRFSIPTSEEAERERQFGKNLFGLSMEAMRKQSAAFETGEMKRVRLDYGEELFNRVRKAVEKDSGLGKRAVDRILSNEGGLATQEEEVAMALEVAKLTRQLTSFDERLDEPGISSADVNSILNQIDATKDQMNRTMQAIYESGTKLSRAFYARQLAFNNKYELQNIYQRARRAKGGAKLTKEEESKIFSQAERILKDTEAFDKLEREKDKLKIPDLIDLIAKQVDEIKAKGQRLGDEGAAVLRETPPTPGLRGFDLAYESLNDFMKDRVNRLDNRMSDLNSLRAELAKRKQISEAKASLPESELSAMTEAEILRKIEELEKGIAEDVGAISQGLGIEKKKKTPKTILEEAKKKIAELNEPIEPSKPRKKTPLQQLLEEHSDTRMSLDDFVKKSDELGLDKETATRLYRDFNSRKGAYAQELPDSVYGRLLRKFVEEGERDTNEIAKKISKWLGDNGYGDISPGDVMERVSGYGKKIFPSQEEVAKISRQKRAEMLVLSQIRDIEENLRAPELTGAQRDKAHAELRELMKKRNDMMRDLGIQRQSPEAQFANARDRAIRALENRREELMRILSGEKEYRRRENKTRIKDADEKALFEEVRKLSDQVRDLYDKDEPITAEKWNAERERRLTKAIDAIQERIKKGDFLSNEKAEFERTKSVKGLEETLESLREDFNQMKDAAHPELKIEAKQKAITKALNDRIIDLNKIIENGRELSEKSNVPETPEMKEAREVIKELNEKLKIKEWPDRRLESLQKSLEKADKAINSNLPPEAKKKYENLKTLEIKQAEEDLKNKRYTRLLQSQERKWKKKLADQDFTPKKKEQRALDDKQKEIKRRIEETKEEIEKTIKDLQFEQLSPLEKAGEYLVRWKRYAILSSPISVFKLTSAAMTRAGTMGIENYMRTPFDILFPKAAGELRKIGVLESRATSKEYADAIAKGLSDGMRDAADTLKKGQSEIDAKYGKKNMDKEGWTNFFGRLHGMLKAPVKRSAFELAMSKQIRGFMAEKGREPSPDELLPMQMRAYEWANRQIFMNDNAITSAWNSSLNTLEQKGYKNLASLARFMLPIVKVPTNIAKETLQYTPLGIAKGTYDMMNVVRAGLESIKDKPEIAESILRNFNKGFIGTGLMMLGYAMPQIAGGFYEKGEKRHEDEPDFGEMMIGGVRIPKWMLHAPFFEVIQLGSTMRRAVDHSMEKHGERDYAEGAVSGLKGVLDELPFIAEMGRVSDAFDNQKSRNRFLGDLAASAIIPAAVGYTARKSDTEAPEGAGLIERLSAPTVKRETVGETLGETIKKSVQAQVPGLREQLLPRVDNPFGPGIKVPKPLQDWEKAGHPMPSVSTRVDFEKGYGKVSDARWMTYVSTRGRAIRQAMAEKLPQLMSMPEEDKRRAIQQITKRASSEGRVAIGLSD